MVWNDIGYPYKGKVKEILAYYYNNLPDGVVDDRLDQSSNFLRALINIPPFRQIINRLADKFMVKGGVTKKKLTLGDFFTPEYQTFENIVPTKWESCRGLGQFFGYNQLEMEENYIKAEDLIRSFIDIVSKNGNLLINIGPKSDGTVPEPQMQCLLGLGEWLDVNGEAIFGTKP